MSRRLTTMMLASVIGLAGVSTSAVAASPPILAGPWASFQEGYGHARPSTIYNGGDPTGLVKHVEWLTWGGPKAVGLGFSTYVAPGEVTAEGTVQSAVVMLFNLGTCHRHRAYNAISWFFPQHDEHFDPHHYINACTGRYHE